MYEKFTDRSRNVMDLAKKEAKRYCHRKLNTGNILLALFLEGSGVAAISLDQVGLNVTDTRKTFEQVARPAGRGSFVSRLLSVSLDAEANVVVDDALQVANSLGEEFAGTEHILLASTKHGFLSTRILAELGVQPNTVWSMVHELLGIPQSYFE